MLSLLSFAGAALLAPPISHGAEPAASPVPDPRAARVIINWLKIYRRGKWDLSADALLRLRARRGGGAPPPSNKGFLIVKRRLLPDSFRGALDHRKEIDLLCGVARQTETESTAQAVLQVAAVGLDQRVRYTSQMAPASVRRIGEAHLLAMKSDTVTQYLAKAAEGNPGGSDKFRYALQAAALRALGARKSSAHRTRIAAQLASTDPSVRAAAAHALGALGEAPAIEALARRLPSEGDATALIEILTAIDRIRAPLGENSVKLIHMQMATLEASRALGRLDSWRPDMAVLDFLEKYRSKRAIPALIQMLERFENEPQNVKSGRLSGRLRVRTHEVLTTLTGARIAMTEPARWRAFWDTNKDSFKLAKQEPSEKNPKGTSGGGFFNIPVQGKRVVFVIDISGSMQQPMEARGDGHTVTAGGRSTPKIEVLKKELWKAIEALPSDTKFNVVHYHTQTGQWQKGLVDASDRNKKRFKSWLDKQRANGGTNIYDAMKLALKIKSLVYGQHYDSNVDEMFLLSDGVPTAGEITNPQEILRTVSETNKFSRVKINTVYLEGRPARPRAGPPGQPVPARMDGASLMKNLARQNGGKCVIP